jgi:hypothetical protein
LRNWTGSSARHSAVNDALGDYFIKRLSVAPCREALQAASMLRHDLGRVIVKDDPGL